MTWRVLSRTLGFASTVILARLLAPQDFGIVAMAGAFVAAIDALAQFNPGTVLLRRHESDTRLHNTVFTMQVIRSAASGAVVILFARLASSWFSEPRLTPLVWALGGLLILSGFQNIGTIEFQQTLRYEQTVRMLILPRILQIATTLLVAWYTRSYWALLAGVGAMRVSQTIMSYAIHPYRPRFSLAGWREVAGFSFWLWADSVASLAWGRSATFIVGRFFGSAGLGLYQVGSDVGLMPMHELVAPVNDVLIAGQAALERHGTRASENVVPVALAMLLLIAPITISLSAGAGYVVMILLGKKWWAAQPLVETLAWICLVTPFAYACAGTLIAQGRVRQRFLVTGVASLVQIIVVAIAAKTGNLTNVAVGLMVVATLESALYVVTLGGLGRPESLARAGWALGRILAAGGVAVLLLLACPYAWLPEKAFEAGQIGPMQAFLPSLTLGVLSIAGFGSTVVALWWLAGRPEGPERLLLRAARSMLGKTPLRHRVTA